MRGCPSGVRSMVATHSTGVRVPHLSQKCLRGGTVDTSGLDPDSDKRSESSSLSEGTKKVYELLYFS